MGCRRYVTEHVGSRSVRIYRADVTAETTVLTEAGRVAYEADTRFYVPLEKTLVADRTDGLSTLATRSKLESITVLGPDALVLSFDNDYGFDADDDRHLLLDPDASRAVLLEVRLAAPLE